MAKWLLVLSALVAVSTAAITTTNQVKHLDDKKCIVCYGHIASAYMECIQATIKHPGEPDKASEECNRATDDAMTYCPDNCLHKPKGFYGASNLGLEKPSKYSAVKDTPQQDKCNVCYGSIATAFMECLQGSYAHRDRPEMVEQLCNEATEQAYKRCSSDGCMKKAKGCGLKTEDFLLKAEDKKVFLGDDVLPPATMKVLTDANKFGNASRAECLPCYGRVASAFIDCLQATFSHPNQPEMVDKVCDRLTSKALQFCPDGCFNKNSTEPFPKPPVFPPQPTPVKDNEIEEDAVKVGGPRECPMGMKICVAEGSGNTVCCPVENACCGVLKWDVGGICCPKGWCCNKKESYYVPQCVPPLLC